MNIVQNVLNVIFVQHITFLIFRFIDVLIARKIKKNEMLKSYEQKNTLEYTCLIIKNKTVVKFS